MYLLSGDDRPPLLVLGEADLERRRLRWFGDLERDRLLLGTGERERDRDLRLGWYFGLGEREWDLLRLLLGDLERL